MTTQDFRDLDRPRGQIRAGARIFATRFPAVTLRRMWAPRLTPSLMLVSVPKSGTAYINAMFRAGLGLHDYILSNRYFPSDQIDLDLLPAFGKGGYVASSHIEASETNLQILDTFIPRWIVHFRDPRSVLLSWVHHVGRLASEGRMTELLRVTPAPPPELHARPFAWRLDWHFDHFLPHVVTWMTNWLTAAERMPNRFLITEFLQLKAAEADLARAMQRFIGGDSARYNVRPVAKTMANHFRKGERDEWRSAFSLHQLKRANRMVPDALRQRFGWPE